MRLYNGQESIPLADLLQKMKKMEKRTAAAIIHEKLKGYQRLGCLKHPMLHQTMDTMSQVLVKLEHYSSFGAQAAYQKRKKTKLYIFVILHVSEY